MPMSVEVIFGSHLSSIRRELRISSSQLAGALAAVPSVDMSFLSFLDHLSATAETTLLIRLA
jgi:hypothetical protein